MSVLIGIFGISVLETCVAKNVDAIRSLGERVRLMQPGKEVLVIQKHVVQAALDWIGELEAENQALQDKLDIMESVMAMPTTDAEIQAFEKEAGPPEPLSEAFIEATTKAVLGKIDV